MEEVVTQQSPFTSSSAAIAERLREQQAIDELKKDFFRRGGKIDVIEEKIKIEKEKDVYGVYAEKLEKLNKKGKNLKYIHNRRRPQVIVNGFYVGSYDTTELAIVARDKYLACNNLPPVDTTIK
jgi:hypothetical protein